MAPKLGIANDSPSSYHTTKGHSIPPTGGTEEAEAMKAKLPKAVSLDAKTATVEQVVEAIKVAGGLVILNAVSHEALDFMKKDMRPKLNEDIPWGGDFFPKETRRAYSLLGSKAFAPSLPSRMRQIPHHQELFLALEHPPSLCTATTGPTKFVAEKADVYLEGLQCDPGIGWFVAGKGRHESERLHAIHPRKSSLRRGDAFMMFASCYQGDGANTTTDQEILLFSCSVTRGWLRQEENQYVLFTREETLAMDKDVQKIAEYELSGPLLGWVKITDPMIVIDPSVGWGNGDLFQKDEKVLQDKEPVY